MKNGNKIILDSKNVNNYNNGIQNTNAINAGTEKKTTNIKADSLKLAGDPVAQRRAEALDVAINAIEKADKYRWIPCSERLPDLYEDVMIQSIYGHMIVGILDERYESKAWYIWGDDWMILDDQFFTFDSMSKIYSVKDVLSVHPM